MIGRGCRSLGVGSGELFLQGDPKAKRDAWELLQIREEGQGNPGGANLRILFKNSEMLSQGEALKLTPLFGSEDWRCAPGIVMAEHEPEFKLLQKVDQRRMKQMQKKEGASKNNK